MLFFEQHFNRHHFFHAPHRWFLALLLSPIHFAEIHYKKKYHLNFAHAKKLFFLDMVLLFSTVVIGGAALMWWLYDPTVTDLVNITLTPSSDRIKSGEKVLYTITYANQSDVLLTHPNLSIHMPVGFQLEKVDNRSLFSSSTQTFNLEPLPPRSEGKLTFEGIFFDEPQKQNDLFVSLSYQQENGQTRELKTTRILSILRGSTLALTLESPDKILGNGSIPAKVIFENTGETPLEQVVLPLLSQNGVRFEPDTELSDKGGARNNSQILFSSLAPGEKKVISGRIVSLVSSREETLLFTLIPTVRSNSQDIPQTPLQKKYHILFPALDGTFQWKNNPTSLKPGDEPTLLFTLKNTGNIPLEKILLSIPLSNMIQGQKLSAKNKGSIQKTTFLLSPTHSANLTSFQPGESKTFEFIIPTKSPAGAINPELRVEINLQASLPELPEAQYQNKYISPTIPLGTQLNIQSQVRYYSPEGDQLGRGPLPPKIGKETKYLALLQLGNTSSDITKLTFEAILPPGIVWTGKTSVSQGNDVQFDPASRKVNWSLPRLAANSTAGIYIELSYTPSADALGSIPTLLEGLHIEGEDAFTAQKISLSPRSLSGDLANDPLGKAKGVQVVE